MLCFFSRFLLWLILVPQTNQETEKNNLPPTPCYLDSQQPTLMKKGRGKPQLQRTLCDGGPLLFI